MELPVQPVILSIPAIGYYFFQKRKGKTTEEIGKDLGLVLPEIKYFVVAIIIAIVAMGLTYLMRSFVPREILNDKHLTSNIYSAWHLSLVSVLLAFLREIVYTAFGEELFFRGFLGHLLFKRFGFGIGNIIQAILFLLPHILLLAVSTSLAPILVFIVIFGWLNGWLRNQSQSILPGILTHALVNAFAAALVMIQ
jgi:membrane protease YdiL (CAAX protease family)